MAETQRRVDAMSEQELDDLVADMLKVRNGTTLLIMLKRNVQYGLGSGRMSSCGLRIRSA